MKKAIIVIIFIGGVLINGCSDDSVTNSTSEKLIGFWIPTTILVEGNILTYDDHEDCGFDVLRFRNQSEGSYTDVYDCEEVKTSFEYSLMNKSLEINFGSTTQMGYVSSISEEELSLEFEYDFDDDGDIDTVIENYRRDLIIPNN
jgi:hypothetical protein